MTDFIFIPYFPSKLYRKSMRSQLYSEISYAKNDMKAFVTPHEKYSGKNLKVIHPKDERNNKYASLMQKLFSEIEIVKESLWICLDSSIEMIRVYFSQPDMYPVSHCCGKCVYVEYQCDLNGSIFCSHCNKQIYGFVYASENSIGNSDGDYFRMKQKQIKNKKDELKEIYISQKYKSKNLKDNYFSKQQVTQKGSFILEVKSKVNKYEDSFAQKEVIPVKQKNELDEKLQETKMILEEIFN